MNHKRILSVLLLALLSVTAFGCKSPRNVQTNEGTMASNSNLGLRNLERAIGLIDTTMLTYFSGQEMVMSRYYNPLTKVRSSEQASVWMYTAAIESINTVLHGLTLAKQNGHTEIYDAQFARYAKLLGDLYRNADYYLGTFELTSFTQTKSWSVYAVDRVNQKGEANVEGVFNVYDDQMWLIRELLESYRLTGERAYLDKAEYLTAYVLDGWDTTIDQHGNENGGIPWGPGYVTKHACSNGPLISALVWLHKIYAGKPDEIEYRYLDTQDRKTRKSVYKPKSAYYLDYAVKVYDWQYKKLLDEHGVYTDMMGGCGDCAIKYETVAGVRYRANTQLTDPVGEVFSYNSGTMLSGGVDLYQATNDVKYSQHTRNLSEASFRVFATLDKDLPGYYTYGTDGFQNWFNGVLLRGFIDVYKSHSGATDAIASFQQNLDYGYSQFKQEGLLPADLLSGWDDLANGNGVEGMFQFTFATEYALLARYEFENTINQK
ncbi:glycoside hydrolase family 76 protein [Sphingobacterium sp. JB170]|uniref:glycoside hydrolase family 76 protein n=1 Tax=Sphingobacterium sp. JB170 TaxID=1434842 RepID=UPI000B3639F5|nr:glycoside hydrolase family 76 protein [Sphingobacterium sp. JB170]